MSCVLVVNTSCCTSNCTKAEESSTPEYEVSSDSDGEEEETTIEDIEKSSVKTFPWEHRP